MNVLISGINGFAGTALSNSLKQYYNIYGTYNTSFAPQNGFFEIDLTDAFSVNKFLAENKDIKIDVIIHLASKTALANNLNDTNVLIDNVKMIENICLIAKFFKIKHFINFSSSSVYPNINGVFNETCHPCPLPNNDFLYGLSKLNAEYLCDFLLNKTITITHLRVAMIFGDGMNETRLLPMIKKELAISNTITLLGNGKRLINYIYIDDLVKAVNYFIRNPVHDVINISSNCESIYEFAEKIIKQFGNSESKIVLKPEGNQLKFKLDTTKFKTLISQNV